MADIRPFANGIHYAEWTGINCERCRKSCDSPQNPRCEPCEIEEALIDGTITGTVSPAIAARMGHTSDAVLWRCSEFAAEEADFAPDHNALIAMLPIVAKLK